jgi:hypothetical protein
MESGEPVNLSQKPHSNSFPAYYASKRYPMKAIRPLLPVAALTAALSFSCNAGPGSQDESLRKADYSRSADSVSYSPAESKAPEPGTNSKVSISDNTSGDISQMRETVNNKSYFAEVFASSGARPNALDSTHRFIRTADIKFRVKNVVGTTYAIEGITARFGGYVASSHLESQMIDMNTVKVSEDSSLETMRYRVVNTIVMRIPVSNLDTTLKSLVPLIDFLDYRNVNTNDITLNILTNQLQQKRQAKYNLRLSNDIDQKGKKLDDIQGAETGVLLSEEAADNALLDNLRLDDQVRYSTISLNIYQNETFRQELVKNEKTVSSYEPGLGEKLLNALQGGWHGLKAILVVVVMLWPLWLVGAAAWIFIRFLLKKQKS